MAVKGRLPLLKHTIERLYNRNNVYKVICSGDDPKDRKVCEAAGAEWIQEPNRPLGRKWNAAFKAAEKYNPDACLFVGSSDWISDNWIPEILPLLDEYDMVGLPGCHFLHIGRNEMKACYWPGYTGQRSIESIGIGRMISSRVLSRLHFYPFNSQLDKSLDGSMQHIVTSVAGKIHLLDSKKVTAVSISTDEWPNKHRFSDHYLGFLPSEKINPVDLIEKGFEEANLVFTKP